MGEIADDIIDGACCAYCSQYFQCEHGYPVLCDECWRTSSKAERKGYQPAIEKELS